MEEHLQNTFTPGLSDLRLFVAAMDATSNGVVITDHLQPDEPIIYCNKAFETLTGYHKQEIIGHNCRFLQGDDRDQPVREKLREAIEKEEHIKIEIRNYRKDGSMFWNELIMSPVKDDAGRVTHFIGVQNDITRRRNAEAALVEERAHLEERVKERTHELEQGEAYLGSIVETVRESLLVLDTNLKVLSINEHFCNFFHLTDEEVVGKLIFDIGNGQWNIPELHDLLANILPHNNPFEGFELESTFPQIGKKLLVLNARQITFKGKYQDRILLAIEDLTERRETERRKEDFISIASHEMKTPLTSIKGNVQIMKRKMEQNQDTTYQYFLDNTTKSIGRLEKLIGDLLDVAKLQSGQIEFNYEVVNFDKLLQDTVSLVRDATTSHQINVSGETGQQIMGDYSRLEQVIINLLSNAVKYSPKANEVDLHLTTVGDYVKVAITDTGVGISRKDQKKIFERFYRADKVQEKFPGVGVGLYVCNQIILEHQGTLWVKSEEGNGSVFNFTIPIKR